MEHSIPQQGTFPSLYAHLDDLTQDLAPNQAMTFSDKDAKLRITRDEVPMLTIATVVDDDPVTLIWDDARGRGLHYPPDDPGGQRRVEMSDKLREQLQLVAWSNQDDQHFVGDGLAGTARRNMVSRLRLEVSHPQATHAWHWDEMRQDAHPVTISMSGSPSIMAAAQKLGDHHYLACVDWTHGSTVYAFRIPA